MVKKVLAMRLEPETIESLKEYGLKRGIHNYDDLMKLLLEMSQAC